MAQDAGFYRTLMLRALLSCLGLVGCSSTDKNSDSAESKGDSIEAVFTNASKTDYSAIKIETMEDMKRLYKKSLPIIFSSLILEEVPMQKAYDDYGRYKGRNNTIGVGSTYITLNIDDYDNPKAKWYKLHHNPNTAKSLNYSYSDMLKNVIGWGMYRTVCQDAEKPKKFVEQKTVLERMFTHLKGCTLRPNEFAALHNAVYNNELNISKLLPYIKAHCNDKFACANAIKNWHEKVASNSGTKSRCVFESLVFLNADGFCEKIMDLGVCPAAPASSINAVSTCPVFTRANYIDVTKQTLKKYQAVVYKKYTTPRKCCEGIGGAFGALDISVANETTGVNDAQKKYDKACRLFNDGKYRDALNMYLTLESEGVNVASLYNDIAVSYLKLGKNKECIDYCRKTLASGEVKYYSAACYNAAIAYERSGNGAKAEQNYKSALEHYKEYGVSSDAEASNVDFNSVYQNAYDKVRSKTR